MKPSRLYCRPILMLFVLPAWLAMGVAQAGIEDGPRHVPHPEWMDPGIVDLQDELGHVRDQGLTGLMLMFSTEGCTYCAAFVRASLGDPVLRGRLQRHFVAIGLEIFDDAEMTDPQGEDVPIKRFAERHKAGMAPTLLFFGPDGRLVFRAIGYQSPSRFARILDYLIGGHHRQQTFGEYLAINPETPPAGASRYANLREDTLFDAPPYALSRRPIAAEVPLLVLFESTGCGECAEFHDNVLALDEVRQLLSRFQVVRLDTTDRKTRVLAPDGSVTTPAQWFGKEGFTRQPALLFVSEGGETVLRVDAVVERQRMLNAAGLVLERAYEKGWSYQRFARSKAIERNRRSR